MTAVAVAPTSRPRAQVGLFGDTLNVELVLVGAQVPGTTAAVVTPAAGPVVRPSPPSAALAGSDNEPSRAAAPRSVTAAGSSVRQRRARKRRHARRHRQARRRRRARQRHPSSRAAAAPTGGAGANERPQPRAPAAGAAATTVASAGHNDRAAPQGQRYGANGPLRGAQRLAPAFAHALPNAVAADRAWSALPVGPQGEVEVVLLVDREGKLQPPRVGPAPAALKRIARRTWMLLRAGTYTLSNAPGQVGRETLQISVTLSDRAPLDHPNAKPTDAFEMGSAPPRGDKAGAAHFTLASGRHFAAQVRIILTQPSSRTN